MEQFLNVSFCLFLYFLSQLFTFQLNSYRSYFPALFSTFFVFLPQTFLLVSVIARTKSFPTGGAAVEWSVNGNSGRGASRSRPAKA